MEEYSLQLPRNNYTRTTPIRRVEKHACNSLSVCINGITVDRWKFKTEEQWRNKIAKIQKKGLPREIKQRYLKTGTGR